MMETMSEKEIAKRLSVVLTDPIKTPYMTVEELVVFGRYPYLGGQIRLTTEDWNIVTSAIQDAGIESLRNRQITTLSDGERQKTMLARSLAQQTTFIILDEPAAFLDFPSKIELMQLLKNLAINLKKSILLSTHDIEMAIALADNIWLIDKNSHFISEKPDILLNNHVISKTFDIPDSFFDTTEQRYNFLNKSHF